MAQLARLKAEQGALASPSTAPSSEASGADNVSTPPAERRSPRAAPAGELEAAARFSAEGSPRAVGAAACRRSASLPPQPPAATTAVTTAEGGSGEEWREEKRSLFGNLFGGGKRDKEKEKRGSAASADSANPDGGEEPTHISV